MDALIVKEKICQSFTCFSFASNTGAVFFYEMIPQYIWWCTASSSSSLSSLDWCKFAVRKTGKKDSKNKKSRKNNCIELITTLIHIFLVLTLYVSTLYSI